MALIGCGKRRYFPNVAEKKYHKRRKRGLTLQKNSELKVRIKRLLKKGWSPEQIAGRLKKENIVKKSSNLIFP